MRYLVKVGGMILALCIVASVGAQEKTVGKEGKPKEYTFMTASVASLKTVQREATQMGVPLPAFLTAKGLEEALPILVPGSVDDGRPLRLHYFFTAGQKSDDPRVAFAVPVKKGTCTIERYTDNGATPNAAHKDMAAFGHLLLRRTNGYLVFCPFSPPVELLREFDEKALVDTYKVKGRLAYLDFDFIKLRKILPGALKSFYEGGDQNKELFGSFLENDLKKVTLDLRGKEKGVELVIGVSGLEKHLKKNTLKDHHVVDSNSGLTFDWSLDASSVLRKLMKTFAESQGDEIPHWEYESSKPQMNRFFNEMAAIVGDMKTGQCMYTLIPKTGRFAATISCQYLAKKPFKTRMAELGELSNAIEQKEEGHDCFAITPLKSDDGREWYRIVLSTDGIPSDTIDFSQKGDHLVLRMGAWLPEVLPKTKPTKVDSLPGLQVKLSVSDLLSMIATIEDSPLYPCNALQVKLLSDMVAGETFNATIEPTGGVGLITIACNRSLIGKVIALVNMYGTFDGADAEDDRKWAKMKELAEACPDVTSFSMNLAEKMVYAGKTKEALPLLESLLAKHKDSRHVRSFRGLALIGNKDYKEGLQDFLEILKSKKQFAARPLYVCYASLVAEVCGTEFDKATAKDFLKAQLTRSNKWGTNLLKYLSGEITQAEARKLADKLDSLGSKDNGLIELELADAYRLIKAGKWNEAAESLKETAEKDETNFDCILAKHLAKAIELRNVR